jgi:hypothetical protein
MAEINLTKGLLLWAAILLFSGLAFGTEAHAVGNCPAGMEQVKLGSITTCSPPVSSRTSSGIDPKAIQAMKSDGDPSNNPKFKSLVKGEWAFPRPTADELRKANAASGDFCSAVFMTVNGVVSLKGPGEPYRGAMLTFVGPDIPKPPKNVKRKITLTQAPDPAATFQAFNYTDSNIGLGVIAVVVPTIEAALDSMVDVQPFKLEIDGRVVMDVTWNNALMARDKLRSCVNGK